jgi:predicted flap endonuclease-1-like 5' DNA nuclease
MMAKINYIEGIGEAAGAKLTEANVKTTKALLEVGKTKKGRQELAKKTGLPEKNILKWVNAADLLRLKGIGEEYAQLLEAAGIDTVAELAQRVPANLHQKLAEVNLKKKLVRQLPTEKRVAEWVEQAKTLPRMVEY